LIQAVYGEFKRYGASTAAESNLKAYETQSGSKAGKSPFIFKEGLKRVVKIEGYFDYLFKKEW